jgi:hypothetical protein
MADYFGVENTVCVKIFKGITDLAPSVVLANRFFDLTQ